MTATEATTQRVADRSYRIGIDLGGSKIAGAVVGVSGAVLVENRIATPAGDYASTLAGLAGMVEQLEAEAARLGVHRGSPMSVGVGMPGSIAPRSGLVQNANSTWLNGRPLQSDLAACLRRPVRLANDANCFALSEARDGAAAGADTMVGVILGTGCGGGIVIGGRLVDGQRGIGGEWGHNPLPWAEAGEHPGPKCWCGRRGCMETWVSGPGLLADHRRHGGMAATAQDVVAAAISGDGAAEATLERHASRLARGLAALVNLLDPDVIVLGGGLSQAAHLYHRLPRLMAPHLFAEDTTVAVRPPRWGDASGVRGAAWLWEGQEG